MGQSELSPIFNVQLLGIGIKLKKVVQYLLKVKVGVFMGAWGKFFAVFGLTLLIYSIVPLDSFAQYCQTPPAATNPSPTACNPATDGTLINSLPYSITTAGTYCLNFSPPSTNLGGITISGSNITLKGQNRLIYADLTISDGQNVTVSDLNSQGGLSITAHDIYNAHNSNITVTRSSFHGGSGGGALGALIALNGLNVSYSRFVCSCSQTDIEPMCILIQAPHPGELVDNVNFDHNVVESDCVKNFKLVGGSYAGTPILHHNVTNNWFHDLRNNTIGNESVNLTWRNITGPVGGTRNSFANNNIVSEGNSACLYLRDDVANIDFDNNCCELKNPNGLPIFYGAVMTASGVAPPSIDVSGLHFDGNRIYSPNDPAMWFEGYHENDPSANNQTIISNNILVSNSAQIVHFGQTETGALWKNNTFYDPSLNASLWTADKTIYVRASEFYNNIFFCNSTKGCFTADPTAYTASNNLFYNLAGSKAVQIYVGTGYPLTLADWQAGVNSNINPPGHFTPEDPNSKFGDPLFVNRSLYDFHLTQNSPARGMGTSLSDVGALPFQSPNSVPPAAPENLMVH